MIAPKPLHLIVKLVSILYEDPHLEHVWELLRERGGRRSQDWTGRADGGLLLITDHKDGEARR